MCTLLPMGVGKKEVSTYYFLLNFTVVLTVEQMGNIVSVCNSKNHAL